MFDVVLGSARTGLIFTGIQEGAQPGGLTQSDQTEQGIPYDVPSWWVLVGGELSGGNSLAAWEWVAAVMESVSLSLDCAVCVVPSFSIRAGTGTTLIHWCNAQSIHFIAPLAWLYKFFMSVHTIMLIRIGYRHKSRAVHAPHIPLWLVTMH